MRMGSRSRFADFVMCDPGPGTLVDVTPPVAFEEVDGKVEGKVQPGTKAKCVFTVEPLDFEGGESVLA